MSNLSGFPFRDPFACLLVVTENLGSFGLYGVASPIHIFAVFSLFVALTPEDGVWIPKQIIGLQSKQSQQVTPKRKEKKRKRKKKIICDKGKDVFSKTSKSAKP